MSKTSMKVRKRIAVGLAAWAALLLFAALGWAQARPTADEVMADFHAAEGRCEGMLQDPLILNADIVKGRVIEDIKNPQMDKRRYAIGFLGNVRAQEALPTLRAILADEAEIYYFRADALQSIFQIDEAEGRELAANYADTEGFLGMIARDVLAGGEAFYRRSWLDAFLGRH